MYPYVIPFSGAAMANDPALKDDTVYTKHRIEGTFIEWDQPSKILPRDRVVREAILEIEANFETCLEYLEARVAHLPSRLRSLLWIACASPVLAGLGQTAPSQEEVLAQLLVRLPPVDQDVVDGISSLLYGNRSLAVVNA